MSNVDLHGLLQLLFNLSFDWFNVKLVGFASRRPEAGLLFLCSECERQKAEGSELWRNESLREGSVSLVNQRWVDLGEELS